MLAVDFIPWAGLTQSSLLLGALWEQHCYTKQRQPKYSSRKTYIHCFLSQRMCTSRFFFFYPSDCTGILALQIEILALEKVFFKVAFL